MKLLSLLPGGVFDYDKIRNDIEDLNNLITNPDNWNDITLINKSQEKLKQNKDIIFEFDFVSNQFNDFKEFIDIYETLNSNEINELVSNINTLKSGKFKIKISS